MSTDPDEPQAVGGPQMTGDTDTLVFAKVSPISIHYLSFLNLFYAARTSKVAVIFSVPGVFIFYLFVPYMLSSAEIIITLFILTAQKMRDKIFDNGVTATEP
jgi:hypothetical protein